MQRIQNRLTGLQERLNFDHWMDYPQFRTNKGLGRVGLTAFILGVMWGAHLILWVQLSLQRIGLCQWCFNLSDARAQLLCQWCIYFVGLCTFHLLEFFTTAVWNPSVATADSFLVNHSTGYTAAALTSWTEFWLRFSLAPSFNIAWLSLAGLLLMVVSQVLRSLAMLTAAESFNHFIQTAKKENHVLVTHGIYRYLRHPSYVGFYYWSISTQLLLGNLLHATVFAVVSWSFLQRRIAYEEDSLCQLFPEEYPDYVSRSYTGIPFVTTKVKSTEKQS